MHEFGRALKAVVLLAAALPLAALGNEAVDLAPGEYFLAAVKTSGPATVAVAETGSPTAATSPQAEARGSSETRGLEHAIEDAGPENAQGLDDEEIDELEQELEQELAEVEAELEDLDVELEERDDELDALDDDEDVEDSDELVAAEDKLRALEADLKGLDRQLDGIDRRAAIGADPAPLLAEARALGSGIEALDDSIRDLDRLIDLAEDLAD